MTNQRFEELFDKAYEGGSFDSTEAVELVDELDSSYKKIGHQRRVIMDLALEIKRLRKELLRKGVVGA